MATVKLKHVYRDKDRQGRVRWRYRKVGSKSKTLPGLPGSTEFMDALNAIVAEAAPTPKKGLGIAKVGTVAALRTLVYQHAAFTTKKVPTQRSLRSYIDRLAIAEGHKHVAGIEQRHVQARVDIFAGAGKAAAARNFLIAFRLLIKVAIAVGWRKKGDDPTIGVELPKITGKGYRAWTEANATTYEAAYDVGTRERLAYEFFSCTALRRSDVAKLGRQHIDPLKEPMFVGSLKVTHLLRLPWIEKNGEPLELFILPPLQAAIDALPPR
jgi:hypothetical protein